MGVRSSDGPMIQKRTCHTKLRLTYSKPYMIMAHLRVFRRVEKRWPDGSPPAEVHMKSTNGVGFKCGLMKQCIQFHVSFDRQCQIQFIAI